MDRTLPRAAAAGTGEDSGFRRAVDRRGLLVFALIAYAIFWTLAIVAFIGIEAGTIDPDGAFVGIATTVAPAAPLFAALIVLSITHGRAGLTRLWRSMVQWRVDPRWYVFVFIGIPLVMTAAVLILTGAAGLAALVANADVVLTQLPLAILSIAVFTGIAEEPGWRGYAQPWANRRYSPLIAALIVSTIWAVWHLPNALFNETAVSAAIHVVVTAINGVVLAWMYNSTRGSVFIVILAHGAINAMGGLYTSALADTGVGVDRVPYYLLSILAFGLIAAIVVVMTRGRLGMPDAADEQSAFSVRASNL
jgi:membrane protease YdiL (CAAX protease family)